ncbi:CheR family methyltransferase [Trinickia dinghuensis]|uniref:Protein-glutamate O-methyltransferase CheR n=1 Tax=Trinickia dinghuensis TaxID=2291023 RepID=A0A3D8JZD8_9BURK|nr:protein-glutamate O-methyltransferase CheR [Trinickia dinghuensis]RDU98016.1 protein-glutamate O-methyltransferase CheR [Trinickia dinghuensis]
MTIPPDAQDIAHFRALISIHLGLQIDDGYQDALAQLLRTRGALCGSVTRYFDHFADEAWLQSELPLLARELTVTETYFFRNTDQFAAFSELVLPRVLAAGSHACRILSAGCASGEEPYSLAIAASECFPDAEDLVEITALDINPIALSKAAQGRYSNWSLRDTPKAIKDKWFATDGSDYVLEAGARRAVRFAVGNLARENLTFWQPGRFDVVFCRNVLMYFCPEQARAAIDRITRVLVPGGYLFLGHAETLRGLSNDYDLCHTHGTFYYRRKAEPERYTVTLWDERPDAQRLSASAISNDASWVDVIQRSSERISTLTSAFDAPGAPTHTEAAKAEKPVPLDLTSALECVRGERYGDALRHIADLPTEHANDADVLLLKAVSLSHSGALDQAEAVCRELLARDGLNTGAQYVLAVCREAAGDVRGALEHDQAACYLDPTFAMPRLHLGLLARRQGDSVAAVRELSHAAHLLQREDPSRVLLFGGGFKREALVAMCRAHCDAMGVQA